MEKFSINAWRKLFERLVISSKDLAPLTYIHDHI